ncbi:MAG: helix-turn-helix domain-containing protein [Myxococcota bacterium]|nr:helix-turn-helix domain-containing protein [Myxococcota bacterium]
MPLDPKALFERCRDALGLTQEELGRMLGVSRRTAQRWSTQGIPSYSIIDLARVAHPRDPALATEIVTALGTTLEAAGIVAPAPPGAPAPVPDGVVDAVVCAAAEAMEMMPNEVRPGLLAAFARASEIGLTVDVIEHALRARLHAADAPLPPVPLDARSSKRRSPRD